MRRVALLLLPAAALAGCPKAPPRTGQGPAPVRIPAGCEASLAGVWLHQDAPSWRYVGEDDGGTLVLAVSRVRPDAGTPAAEGGPRIELHRTADGFKGRVLDSSFGPGGVRCNVTFPTEVVACGRDSLTLSTTSTAVVDEQCEPAPQATPAQREEHRLVRAPPEAAGTPDGGTP